MRYKRHLKNEDTIINDEINNVAEFENVLYFGDILVNKDTFSHAYPIDIKDIETQ